MQDIRQRHFMAALCSRCRHYILQLWFLSIYLFFSSPILSGQILDVYHASTHDVPLVGIEMCCTRLTENTGCKIIQKLERGPMPNVMVAPPNIGGALCSTPQSWADAHY